jgi:hypothetical protein
VRPEIDRAVALGIGSGDEDVMVAVLVVGERHRPGRQRHTVRRDGFLVHGQEQVEPALRGTVGRKQPEV